MLQLCRSRSSCTRYLDPNQAGLASLKQMTLCPGWVRLSNMTTPGEALSVLSKVFIERSCNTEATGIVRHLEKGLPTRVTDKCQTNKNNSFPGGGANRGEILDQGADSL